MWRWIRRWADWLRNDLFTLRRARRGGCVVFIKYDAGGQTHAELPIPWLAETVFVEVVLRLPAAARRRADFTLQFSVVAPIPAEAVRPESEDRHRVVFRFPTPFFSTTGHLMWKERIVSSIGVPVLTAEAFLTGLRLHNPTLSVRLGGQTVPAGTFVAGATKSFMASAVLRTPHRLAPLAELGLSVEFRNERTGRLFTVPVTLTAEQRNATEALVTAICPRVPRRAGWWSVGWWVGDREVAVHRVEAISTRRFEEGVRILDARFAVAGKDGKAKLLRLPPGPGAGLRVGPCFLVASGEPGAVGVCRLAVFAVASGNPQPTQLLEQDVLITDAPTAFTPGLLDAAELSRIGAFELRLNGRVLGSVSLSPVPPATISAEGGFKPPPDFTWTAAAEEELIERLGKLGNQNG